MEVQLQVTTPADCEQLPPPVTEAETYVEAAGMVIVSTVPVPCEVLLLKSGVEYVTLPVLSVIGFGDPVTLTTRRSIWSLTVTEPLPLLLALFESGSVPDALPESVAVPPAVGLALTVAKYMTDAPIEVQLQVTT